MKPNPLCGYRLLAHATPVIGLVCLLMSNPTTAQDAASAERHYLQGHAAFRKGQARAAEKHYLLALRADKNHVESYRGLSELYLLQRRYDEALEMLDRTLSEHSNDAALWANRGLVLRDAGRLAEARIAYDKAAALAPEDPEILEKVAGFYGFTGETERAELYSEARRRVLEEGAAETGRPLP